MDTIRIVEATGTSCLPPVIELLAGTYWNERFTREEVELSHLHASAWVIARTADGRVVGSGRAVSDVGKRAFLYDLIVAPELRGAGLGARLVEALLAHPALARTPLVLLGTRDAVTLYERFGFRTRGEARADGVVEMVLDRRLAGAEANRARAS